MLTEWLLLGLGFLLTLATGVFVAAEFALITLDRPDVEREAQHSAAARRVLTGLRTLSTQLSGAQVGITLTTLLVGYLVEPSLARLLSPVLTGAGLEADLISPAAVVLGMILATLASMLIGELLPKNLAISAPLATAKWAVPLQLAFTWVFRPMIRVLNGSAEAILRRMGIEPAEELSAGRSPEELVSLVRRSAEAGTLAARTARLVTRSIGFSDHSASDVMTHRVDVASVHESDTAADVVRLGQDTGHSRFPVVGDGGLDDIVGVVHIKGAIAVPRARRGEAHVASLMMQPLRVPETLRLDPLLVQLRTEGLQLAVVQDEYGGTAGIVTLEDLVEELIGEVVDEHDQEDPRVQQENETEFVVPAMLRPDEIRDLLGVPVPEGADYETVAGYIVDHLGRLAEPGDVVQVAGWRIQVESVHGRRIDQIRVIKPPQRSGQDGAP